MAACKCSPVVHTGLALFQVGVGLLLLVLGYSAPNWADYTVGGMDVNFGMYKYCVNDDCDELPDNLKNAKVDAAKAFGILGTIACSACILNGFLYLVKKQKYYLLSAAIFSLVGFLFVLIEFVLMVVWTKDTTSDFGFCFGVTLSAFIQLFFAPLSFMGARRAHDCDTQAC